jgi:hypothetical protein
MAFGVASITMKIGTDRGNARRAEKLAKSDLNSNKPGPLLKTFGHLGVVQSTNAQVQRYTRQSFFAMLVTLYIRMWSDPQ